MHLLFKEAHSCRTRLELLATQTTFAEWQHYLEGARDPVQLFADHKKLEYLCREKAFDQWQLQWALFF